MCQDLIRLEAILIDLVSFGKKKFLLLVINTNEARERGRRRHATRIDDHSVCVTQTCTQPVHIHDTIEASTPAKIY